MVSTFTPNVQFEEPARGDQVGVWDTPVNNNETLADLILGGITTISGAAGSVVLAAAQFQCKTITFNSTLLASITVTLPTSFKKSYEIQNICTGSSAFVITLQTTAAGGQAICCPPGEIIDCLNDGTNIKFKNLGRVGDYWDYAGSSLPAWVSGCTLPPYLLCDGSAFSGSAYPVLASILGSTTRPDARGRARFATDPTGTRLSSAVCGFSPTTVGAAGGDQLLHAHNHAAVDSGHTHGLQLIGGAGNNGTPAAGSAGSEPNATTLSGNANITVSNSTQGGTAQNIPPAYIGGITMIRAG